MRFPRSALLVLLALSTAAGFGYAWSLRDEAAVEAAARVAAEAEAKELAQRLAEAERNARDLADRLAQLPGEAPPSAAEESGPPRPNGEDLRQGGRWNGEGAERRRAAMAALLSDPNFLAAAQLQEKGALDRDYATLFRLLKLSPAALEKLQGLLLERQNARRDVMASAVAQGLNPRDSRDQLNALVQQTQAESDQSIRALLTAEQYAVYSAYQSNSTATSVLNQLAQRLSYSGTALTDTQVSTVLQTLSSTTNRSALYSDATLQSLQTYLSPEQMTALRQLQAEYQAQRQVQEATRKAREQARATAPKG